MGMNEKIDFWSVLHISIMILIGIVQVTLVKDSNEISFYYHFQIYTVRQLFEDKSFWYKFRQQK